MSKALQKILYVEDEPDIQRVVKLALEAMGGMSVVACSSGEEAIARAPSLAIDLILLDVMMPKMDGPTTLGHLRQCPNLESTPVVFMTAKAQSNEIAYFQALGALDVIAKPFDPLLLAKTLRAIWERAQTVSAQEIQSADDNNEPELTVEQRFAARMAALTQQFQQELPARLKTLRQQWRALRQQWNIETLHELHRSTHNLAGAGATFGYEEMTARARAVDRRLKALLQDQQQPDAALWVEISVAFAELESALQNIVAQLEN
ncbi:MAG TPA: response regulator [Spongiibacteraceae bacterium]